MLKWLIDLVTVKVIEVESPCKFISSSYWCLVLLLDILYGVLLILLMNRCIIVIVTCLIAFMSKYLIITILSYWVWIIIVWLSIISLCFIINFLMRIVVNWLILIIWILVIRLIWIFSVISILRLKDFILTWHRIKYVSLSLFNSSYSLDCHIFINLSLVL